MHNIKIVEVPCAPTTRVLEAALRFGMGVRCPTPHNEALARTLAHRLEQPGQIVLLTGPSGCGKSSLLRAVVNTLTAHEVSAQPAGIPDHAHSSIDAVAGTVPEALRTLSQMGLADALLALRHPGALSDGERARLALACAISRAPGGVVVCDEFASVLDRVCARGLCTSISRCARGAHTSFLLATAHDDLTQWLNWTVLVVLSAIDDPHVIEQTEKQDVSLRKARSAASSAPSRPISGDALPRRHSPRG